MSEYRTIQIRDSVFFSDPFFTRAIETTKTIQSYWNCRPDEEDDGLSVVSEKINTWWLWIFATSERHATRWIQTKLCEYIATRFRTRLPELQTRRKCWKSRQNTRGIPVRIISQASRSETAVEKHAPRYLKIRRNVTIHTNSQVTERKSLLKCL